MAELHSSNDLENAGLQVSDSATKDGNLVFHYKLPVDGLSLRSVGVVSSVPELRFAASPKVPTILEEDIATVFRLVSENKRPEFFYSCFPPTHPMHECRYFMHYSPGWLRWTAVGELLADADWNMKCLQVGVRANEDKSVFKSRSAESQLDGLATCLDFPNDGYGPVMMSCEYAKVQKSNDEVMFPEEPKMKIVASSSSLYSKYITAIYQSVAYFDEPNFLKMQELIKLILAVEWLYKKKGVRVNQEWVMKHTSKPTKAEAHPKLGARKKPPYDMIPQPTVFKRPSSDVTARTWEAVQYETLKTKCGVERQYGYLDFRDTSLVMFNEDGTPCPPEKYLKLMELKISNSYMTAVMSITMGKFDKCLTDEDPNTLLGFCKADIIPDVKSWYELISELTVPIPHIRQHPFVGIGVPMASGGVTTSNFVVREEPVQARAACVETEWKDNYKRSGPVLVVRARTEQVRTQGMYASLASCILLFDSYVYSFFSQEIFDWLIVTLLNLLKCQESSLQAGERVFPPRSAFCLPSLTPILSKNGWTTDRILHQNIRNLKNTITERHWLATSRLH